MLCAVCVCVCVGGGGGGGGGGGHTHTKMSTVYCVKTLICKLCGSVTTGIHATLNCNP